jgi:capsular exopolysaccharide synthesis family protein
MSENTSLVPFDPSLVNRSNHRSTAPVVNLELERTESYFYLRAYWHILFKRRWTVLTVAIVLTILVGIVSFRMQPAYEATARLAVEAEGPEIQSFYDLYHMTNTDDAFLQTQVNILQSDNLAWQTIRQTDLGEHAEFSSVVRPDEPGHDLNVEQNRLIRAFRNHLRVALMRNSHMIEVTFESTDPKLAAGVANALVGNYIEYSFHTKYDATRQASGWMEQQLDELKAKVEKSQQALVDYERQNAIVNVGDKQNVVEQRLADLSKDLTGAQSDRLQKQALDELVSANESQVALLAQSELLEKLEERAAELKTQYADAQEQYGPNFPKVVRLRDQVAEIQSLIDKERTRMMGRIHHDYRAAKAREELLTAAVAAEKLEVGKLSQLLIQHNILQREFDTNQQLYDKLLQRLKDATVSAGLHATNIHAVDRALVPSVPVRPKKLLNLGIAMLVGMILGITLAFVEEGLDNSIKNAEDIERLIGTPTLAIVPSANLSRSPSGWLKNRRRRRSTHDGAVALAVLKQSSSALTESYRALRTAILLSTAPRPPQALLVTSSQPNEGKTCTTVNLAMALAQRGGRVLIIDGDMRKPGVARHLDLDNGMGLSSLLTGAHGVDEALRNFGLVPNLWVLPAGPAPPNPAELLSSPTMEEVMRGLRLHFDHLVVDSPPSLMVTDATLLSNLVDGVILVVESDVTVRGALVRAQRVLESAGGKILGAVLNKVDLQRDGYYYYGCQYGRYYHSYYAEGSKPSNGNNGHGNAALRDLQHPDTTTQRAKNSV